MVEGYMETLNTSNTMIYVIIGVGVAVFLTGFIGFF